MSEVNTEVAEAIVIDHDSDFDIDVQEPAHKAPTPIRRVGAEVEKVSFEDAMRVTPAIAGENGEPVPFNPKNHVAFAPSDELRERLNDLVGESAEDAKAALEKMLEDGEINEMRMARLTEPLSADPVPGRITVVVNPDRTVNSVTVE